MKTKPGDPSKGGEKKVIRAQLAGSWYDDNPAALAKELQGYLDQAKQDRLPDVIALVQPHAGYRFSGPVAAFGARQIAGRTFTRVIVMGPSHRMPLPNLVALPDGTHFATPLGELPLDTDFLRALATFPEFRVVVAALRGENSVEMQIPILQQALGEFRLVPLVIGQLDLAATRAVAQRLRALLDTNTLVVASSDFTHYGENYGYVPFRDNIETNLAKLDLGAVKFIEQKDLDGFAGYCDKTGITLCGQHPIGILLALLPPNAKVRLLKYDTSGRMMGEENMSVSYVSLAFTGTWEPAAPAVAEPAPARAEAAAPAATLADEDRQALLKLARKTLEHYYDTGRPPKSPADVGVPVTPGMKQTFGAFVTLKKGGDLRGCIGEIVPHRALYAAVMERAVDAAINDTRFMPVAKSELPKLEIEISALTPPIPADSTNAIVIGRHGIVLEKRGRSAVFLPQVAPEQGWDLATTLTHLAMKAGLPPDAWKEDATFLVFEAIVFGEHAKP